MGRVELGKYSQLLAGARMHQPLQRASEIRIRFWGYCTILIIRNPQTSIGKLFSPLHYYCSGHSAYPVGLPMPSIVIPFGAKQFEGKDHLQQGGGNQHKDYNGRVWVRLYLGGAWRSSSTATT